MDQDSEIDNLYRDRIEKNKIRALAFQTLIRSIGSENVESPSDAEDIVIFDTGGGRNSTITKRAWHIFEETNHRQEIRGYQDEGAGQICPIVNAVTKATIPGREMPVLLVINYAALIDDPNECESLIVPFEMMRHGIQCDLTPRNLGGEGCMLVDEECFNFGWDEEKLFFLFQNQMKKIWRSWNVLN